MCYAYTQVEIQMLVNSLQINVKHVNRELSPIKYNVTVFNCDVNEEVYRRVWLY